MRTTDPMKRDAEAAKADLMAVYTTFGHTYEIAHKLGGEPYLLARCEELDRIADVFSQCQQLDQPLPDWAGEPVFRFPFPHRKAKA